MMGRQRRDQGRLFYEFRLEDRIPENHLLRRMNVFVTVALADLHKELKPYYSDIGRPSVDPELMIRMLIVGYCYGIRSERKLCQEVELHLAYRWFCKLDLDDKVPHHSTFSENRLGRFRESDLLRHIFERVVWAAMAMGLVKGEGFAVDASVLEANASRYHGKAPDELDWTDKQRQTRAVAEYLAALDEAGEPDPNRKAPKVISPSDPSSAWTAKANKRVQFGYGLNYLIDIENAVIVDVEATPARTYDEVAATKTMIDRTEALLRSEAEAAGRRHGLRHGQVPRLAGQGEEDHAAHPGVGQEQARGRHLLALGLHLGQADAASTSARTASMLTNQRNRASDGRTCATAPASAIAMRARCRAKCCPKHDRTQIAARSPRGRPRCGAAQDEDQGVPQIARSAQARRDALRAPEDPSRLRAAAPARPLRRPRRVPPRRHRAEPQDAGPAPHPAATTARLRVSCVASVGVASASRPTPAWARPENPDQPSTSQIKPTAKLHRLSPPTFSTASTRSSPIPRPAPLSGCRPGSAPSARASGMEHSP